VNTGSFGDDTYSRVTETTLLRTAVREGGKRETPVARLRGSRPTGVGVRGCAVRAFAVRAARCGS